MRHQEILVAHPNGIYSVYVGGEILASTAELGGIDGQAVIITDEHVGPLYGRELSTVLSEAPLITVPAGEMHKNLETVREIYDQMLELGLDRRSTVVAFGGGVINDMAGFVAATYMRGVRFVTCPTTILSMVDASVGGKTGVDMPQGKNLIGAFLQPQAVIADLNVLATLPAAEFRSGLAEIVKHGLVSDPNLLTEITLFEWDDIFEKPLNEELLMRLQRLIADAIEVKRHIIEIDPFEQGIRTHLNLGHTFGHAIEKVSEFSIRHGEAVAIGLVCAAHLSSAIGLGPPDLQYFIENILRHVGLPIRLPAKYDPEAIFAAMALDKKKAGRNLRYILPEGIGQLRVAGEIPPEQVLETLNALREPF